MLNQARTLPNEGVGDQNVIDGLQELTTQRQIKENQPNGNSLNKLSKMLIDTKQTKILKKEEPEPYFISKKVQSKDYDNVDSIEERVDFIFNIVKKGIISDRMKVRKRKFSSKRGKFISRKKFYLLRGTPKASQSNIFSFFLKKIRFPNLALKPFLHALVGS